MSRRKFLCLDCGVDTGRCYEFYFIHDYLWLQAVGSKNGMLCISCIEYRLNRRLTKDDFPDVSINDPKHIPKSDRLMKRMGYGG